MKTVQDLIQQYELELEQDYYLKGVKTILTKSAITKIKQAEQIEVSFDLKQCTGQEYVVIHATAVMLAKDIKKAESFGTVNPKNYNFEDGFGWFGVETAEARAEQRAVIKLLGVHNVYGNEEAKGGW